jgi:glycerol-3-phosphate dehydrogenase
MNKISSASPPIHSLQTVIVGAGAWGTALALSLSGKASDSECPTSVQGNKSSEVYLLCRTQDQAKVLLQQRGKRAVFASPSLAALYSCAGLGRPSLNCD